MKAILSYKGAKLYLGSKKTRRLNDAVKIDLRTRQGNYPLGNKKADPVTIFKALDKIETELGKNKDVLVHCAAGRNRSPFIVTCFIAKKRKMPFTQAVKVIKQRYPKARIEPELQRIGRRLFP